MYARHFLTTEKIDLFFMWCHKVIDSVRQLESVLPDAVCNKQLNELK